MRFDRAIQKPMDERPEAVRHDLRVRVHICRPVEPDHVNVLHQQMIRGNLRHIAARKTDDQDTPFERNAAKRGGEQVPADRVVDDIRTPAIGQRLDPRPDILLAGICLLYTSRCV